MQSSLLEAPCCLLPGWEYTQVPRCAAATGRFLTITSLHHDPATARRGTYLPLIWKPSPAEPVSADVVCSSADVSPGTSSTIPLTRPAHAPHVKKKHTRHLLKGACTSLHGIVIQAAHRPAGIARSLEGLDVTICYNVHACILQGCPLSQQQIQALVLATSQSQYPRSC